MDVGNGLPNAVPGVERAGIVDWARSAEEAGFSSLGTIGRIAYPNYEELISLAAAAAVTERIRLATDVLLLPLRRNAALFAKQAATLDSLSNGRLVLGLAPGGREDDYRLSGADFSERNKIFDRMLEGLTDLWEEDEVGPPTAGGGRPRLLIGGYTEVAFRRAAKYGDGWTQGGATPDALAEASKKLEELWREEGREGSPYKVALFYFGLGDGAEEQARKELGDYYAWLGDYAQQIVDSAAKDEGTVKGYLSAFEQAGADEVICFPASTDPGQVELLAQAIK